MKILLINGSSRPNGCTYTALREIADTLESGSAETEILFLGSGPVRDCTACRTCQKTPGRCVFDDDMVNPIIEKAREADGFVFGTPVYYAHPSGRILSVLDRVFYAGKDAFAHKPGAAVASARRAGTTASVDVLDKYFTIAQMPVGHQTALYDGVARKGRQLKYFYESEAGRYGKKMAYTDGLQCPKQANSPCANTASKLNRICHRADDYMQTTPCAKCCADCEYLVSCGYACALCNAEKSAAKAAQKQAKQKEQDDAARREAEAAERDRDVLDRMKRLETVYDRLQEELGFLDCEYAEAAGIAHYYIERGSKISRYSRTLLGISGDDIDHICRAADFLGVSTDYLLGRTEAPEGVKAAGNEAPSEWPPLEFADGTMESPPKSGPYYCEFCCEGVPLLDIAWWDNELKTWRFSPNGVTIDAECYGWYPLPEDARDAEEEDEHGQE